MNDQSNTNNSRVGNLGQFILGKTLGEGTFGRVKLATHILTGEKVAIKILEKIKILEESDKIRIDREIKILKSLMHKNIIQIYSVIENPTTIFLIMEYVNGGELFEYICLKQKLTELEACKFYQDIINGIEYLHKQGIVHRDLKPENLLLNNKKELKIVDFGLSNIYRKNELLKTPCGSPCYAAPEMILGKKYNGLYVDIWSSGIILFAMVFGYLPFDDPNTDILYKKITDGKFSLPSSASERFRDLIKKILVTDPSKRIGLDGIKAHPWFNLITPKLCQGIFIKKYMIPVDENILEEMSIMNFNKDEVREFIKANRHNHITTTYYLILKKQLKFGRSSISDLSSDDFISYMNDPRNIKENPGRKAIEPKKNTTEISKDSQYTQQSTIVNNSIEPVIIEEKTTNTTKTEETVIGTNSSNSKINSILINRHNQPNCANTDKNENKIVHQNKDNIKNASSSKINPDYHDIYQEDAIIKNQIFPENNKNNNNKNIIKTTDSVDESKKTTENNINLLKKIGDNQYEIIQTETNKYSITDTNLNYTETENNNNLYSNTIPTEIDNNLVYLNTKDNKNIYLDTQLSQDQRLTTEIDVTAKNNRNMKPLVTELDNSCIPEYLPTEINNIATSSQGNNTLFQETDQNNNNNNNNNVANNQLLTENDILKNPLATENNYSNYVVATECDATRITQNKNNSLFDSSFVQNTIPNNVDFLNSIPTNEEKSITTNSNKNIKNNNVLSIMNNNNNSINNMNIINHGSINNNINKSVNIEEINNNKNIKNLIFSKINNKWDNNSNNKDEEKETNKTDDEKDSDYSAKNNKTPKNNQSKIKNYNLQNNNQFKKNVIFGRSVNISNYKNKNSLNSSLNNSYNENTLNTESSVGKSTPKDKFCKTLKAIYSSKDKNKDGDLFKMSKNFFNNYATKPRDQKDIYLRSILKSKAERFKKGFFNTSVSYDKSTDVKNRTFDGKMFESNSKSKSREKSPIFYNHVNKNNINNIYKKNEVKTNNDDIYKNKINAKPDASSIRYKNQFDYKNEILTTDASVKEGEKSILENKIFKNTIKGSTMKNNNIFANVKNSYKFVNNVKTKKYDKRLNITAPEYSEYTKTEQKEIYTIKEDEEYKKNAVNKLKLQIIKNDPQSRNINNNLLSDRSANNSINKTKDSNTQYTNTLGNNKGTSKNKVNNKLPPNSNILNTTLNKNILVTPPKYSNYANFKIKAMKNIRSNNTSLNKTKNYSNNNSVNTSINNNPNENNHNPTNKNTNNIQVNPLFSNTIKKKLLNVSDQMINDKNIKKSVDVKTNNSTIKDNKINSINNNKLDVSPLRIPTDKNSYNNKYKNININFYQNIIINNANKGKKGDSNNNSIIKDEEEKFNETSKRQNHDFAYNKIQPSINKPYSNSKNEGSANTNKLNVYNNNNIKVPQFNETGVNLKIASNSKNRSTSISGSIMSENMSKTTLTSNFSDEELKCYNGPIDILCVFNQRPQKLRDEVIKSLATLKISIKPVLNNIYSLKCQKYKLKFDLEIMKTPEQDNLLVLKFKKTEGPQEEFKSISSKIMSALKSI